jgi:hypothetical protein
MFGTSEDLDVFSATRTVLNFLLLLPFLDSWEKVGSRERKEEQPEFCPVHVIAVPR